MDNVARSLKEVRIYFIAMKVKVQVAQLGPTLCDPMDYTVHAILQARILKWGAFPFSGDIPNPGIEPRSPALQAYSLQAEPQGKPGIKWRKVQIYSKGKA